MFCIFYVEDIAHKIIKHNNECNLKFVEDTHSYFLGDEKLVSVTEKIGKFFPFNAKKVAREVALRDWVCEEEVLYGWDALRENGSYVHMLAEKFCKGEELSSKEKEVIKNVINFFEENPELEIIASEIKVFSSKWKIAGTIDLIVKKDDKLYVVDWKTSKKEIDRKTVFSYGLGIFSNMPNNKYNIYSLQLSVYSRILFDEYGIEIWDSYFVHLRANGSYRKCDRIVLDYEAEELLEN